MKCTYCGAPIEEGRIFCLKCGEEIVWVPDYNAISSYRSQSEQVMKEAARRIVEDKEKQQAAALALLAAEAEFAANENRKRRKKSRIITIIIVMLSVIGCYFGVKYYIEQQNYNSFDYQQKAAQMFYENGDYNMAKEHIDRALEINPDDIGALFVQADILLGQGQVEGKLQMLLDLIAKVPGNIEAYDRIIKVYEDAQQPSEIKALLAQCNDEIVLKHFTDYLVENPVISLPSGKYNELLKVEIYPLRDIVEDIYYTVDGSEPTINSLIYSDAIELPEGHTTLKVVAINDKNIHSDVVEMTYLVELLPPEPPVISPSSGEFTLEEENKIYINVPDGYTAYYAFDEKPTTSSAKYTGAVDMLEGRHTFYAILIDANGKQSEPGIALYNLVGDNNVQN